MKRRLICTLLLISVAVFVLCRLDLRRFALLSTKPAPQRAHVLSAILGETPEALRQYDIAILNLLSAGGLPGAEGLRAEELRTQLDEWAGRVQAETRRHHYRFDTHPEEFDNSEAYFRMLMMAVVVYEDFRIRYNPARISTPEQATSSDHFFSNSQDLFLHGLLSPGRLGTCSSMPVLYVALGRRLGYPVYLAATKGHLFVRWEGQGERLNLEATGKGMNHYDDQHYRQWPFPLSQQEVEQNGYLKAMTPAEELAVFLTLRGACLREAGREVEAREAFQAAARFAPSCLLYRQLAASPLPNTSNPAAPLPAGSFPPVDLLPRKAGAFYSPNEPADPNPMRRLTAQ